MFFGGKRFTTVDIGSYAVKVVRMKKSRDKITILGAGHRKLPFETIKDGEIQDPSIIASKMEDIFSELNFRPRKVITTIPGFNLFTRNIELPDMPENELEEAIKWEAEDYIPFPVEKAVIDYITLDRAEEKINLLLVAAKEDILENYLQPFNRLALRPKVVNIQPMALLSLLEYQGKIKEPVAVINIGAAGTQVVIGDEKNIYLSRYIDTGGEEFTRMIMEDNQLNFHEAEEHKLEHGIEESQGGVNDLDFDLALSQMASSGIGGSNYLSSVASNLASEISRCFEYYSMKFRGESIDSIYLTGGGSRLKKLKEIIENELDQELLPLNPFAGFNSKKEDADYSVAIGLGLSEVLADEG